MRLLFGPLIALAALALFAMPSAAALYPATPQFTAIGHGIAIPEAAAILAIEVSMLTCSAVDGEPDPAPPEPAPEPPVGDPPADPAPAGAACALALVPK